LLVPSVIFEELGLRYYGPIDGHDIPLLIKTFEFLKTQEEPVLLHILTKKGKGYEPAIAKPGQVPRARQIQIESGETAPTPTPTYSEIIGKTLAKFADSNQKIVAITAAMPSGTGLGFFKRASRPLFDVGIAEEHAALFACGLATQGLKPFLTIYSTFHQRAYDMAIHDMALQKLNVALCMDRAGLSGDDGPTHHGLFDIGYLRHIPNWVHMQPKDEDEFVDMLWTMANYNSGPIAVRYPRGSGTGAKPKPEPKLLEIGKAEVVQHGREVAIFGLGNMFEVAEEAARKLEEKGISVALINPRWIKPIDTGTLEFFARSVEVVCTIEDHVLHNGFGCAVMEHLHSQHDQYAGGADRLARSIHRARHPFQSCARNTASQPTRWWKKCCRFCERDLTKVYRTYRKESGLRGAIKGLVRRRYDETRAADAVSFQIEEGEFVGFLGPNGAGKTTVLKMFSGLAESDLGRRAGVGFRAMGTAQRNEAAIQFADGTEECAVVGSAGAGITRAQSRDLRNRPRTFQQSGRRIERAARSPDKMNVMVRELSLGERMKMELISALIHEPKVLFLDEPTIGLDVVSQKRVREFLRIYNSEHRIVTLLTSHYMQDIAGAVRSGDHYRSREDFLRWPARYHHRPLLRR
jgi:transketolase C-terminal domain/subunit/ABC-type multidrug transport system ATPase subunit